MEGQIQEALAFNKLFKRNEGRLRTKWRDMKIGHLPKQDGVLPKHQTKEMQNVSFGFRPAAG